MLEIGLQFYILVLFPELMCRSQCTCFHTQPLSPSLFLIALGRIWEMAYIPGKIGDTVD